jgi:CDP-glucose 4,6-dehydratase
VQKRRNALDGMEVKNKKILVTGGAGFVGSHLVEELVKLKNEVTVFDIKLIGDPYFIDKKLNDKVSYVCGDVAEFDFVKKVMNAIKPEIIFHLAAEALVDECMADPKKCMETNVMGTVNVLEAARKYGKVKAIIAASSDKAYGKLKKEKYVETDPLKGDHPYEISKSCMDLICQGYYQSYKLPIVITRFGNIYGEGDVNLSRLIPGIMKALVKNEELKIRSDGKFIRNYVYVKDVVSGYIKLVEKIGKVKGEAFNLASDEVLSVVEVIKIIEKVLKKKLKYKILNNQKNEIPYQVLDWSKIKKEVGWKAEFEMKKVVKQIWKWYLQEIY